ncbi:MAG: DUF6273 domain-containing protein, partial [Lachnospiraceae bacterium]|nr:DUF6273 domain-containing protein [Lachnospiraceae bacterium]
MKKKIILSILVLALLAFGVYRVIVEIKIHKTPTVIEDLCYSKRYKKDGLVYVMENGVYIPYIAIDTKNYGKDAVILIRQTAWLEAMMYRDENIYGVGGAYYPGSIVDNFLEGVVYNAYSDGMKGIIRNAPVKVHTIEFVSKHFSKCPPNLETIYRHVFALSSAETGIKGSPMKGEDEGKLIPEIIENSDVYYTWLRSEAFGGDDTRAAMMRGPEGASSHIQNDDESYVRPVFTV